MYKMLLLASFCVVLASTVAMELPPDEMRAFEKTFFRSIAQHVAAEYSMLLPSLVKHNASLTDCKKEIVKTEIACKTCVKTECSSEFGNMDRTRPAGKPNKEYYYVEPATRRFRPPGRRPSVSKPGKPGGFSDKLSNFAEGVSEALDMKDFLGGVFNDLESLFGGVVGGIGDVFDGIGSGVEVVGDFFGGIFGRRRRSLRILDPMPGKGMNVWKDRLRPEMKQCVAECEECAPFFMEEESLIESICGEKFETEHLLVKKVFDKIRDLVYANADPREGKPKILIKVEYDEETCDAVTFLCHGVYVTAKTPDGEERYESAYRYNLMVPELTAEELALELFQRWETMPAHPAKPTESAPLVPTDFAPPSSTDEPNKYKYFF